MKLNKLDALTTLAMTLAAAGAVNWGLSGLLNFNLVHRILGKARAAERGVYGVIGLAGAWLAIQLAVPPLIVALAGRRHGATVPSRRRAIVGQRLPTLEGRTLSGSHVTVPDDAAGKVTLLAMGFTYSSRWDVEAWVDAFRERFGDQPDVTLFEMPMIGGLARLAAPMIDAGMRAGTPADLHDRVVTIYGSMRPIREALGATEDADTWVYLIGRDGRVLIQCAGGPDEAKFDQLLATVRAATAPEQRELGRT